MIFGDKIGQNNLSDNESSKKAEKSSVQHLEPFSFSALHFLRNRLLPTGKILESIKFSDNFCEK
jgi:hypothetical protein